MSLFQVAKHKPYLRYLQRVFLLSAVVFIGFFAYSNAAELSGLFANADYRWAFVSVLTWFLLHQMSPLFTGFLLKASGHIVDFKALWLMHCYRLPAKYLPGGVWHTVSRGVDLYSKGMGSTFVGRFLAWEMMVIALTALALGSSLLLVTHAMPLYSFPLILLVVVLLLVLCALPYVGTKAGWLASVDVRTYLLAVTLQCCYWIVAGVSFAFFIQAAVPEVDDTMLSLAAIYVFSWAIGFIAVFAPQGVGVSEWVSAQFFSDTGDLTRWIALLASFRLLILCGDLLAWLPAWFKRRHFVPT